MLQLESLRRNDRRFKEASEKALKILRDHLESQPQLESFGASVEGVLAEAERTERRLREDPSGIDFEAQPHAGALEAIVRSMLRPAYYIRDDKIAIEHQDPEMVYDRLGLLEERASVLEDAARSVGRINLYHSGREYAGTGWMIDEDIVVTNRHVAELFARRDDDAFGWRFAQGAFGRDVEAALDTVVQIRARDKRRADISEVLWIAGSREPDIAFLRVKNATNAPLTLERRAPTKIDAPIGVVGYPAEDRRNHDPALMRRVFGDVYDVKRFAPGSVISSEDADYALAHDASTLGGNSGSVVMNLETGAAVGLHFAGIAGSSNFSVPIEFVSAAMRNLKRSHAAPAIVPVAPTDDAPVEERPESFADRDGYQPGFLGGEPIELPGLGRWREDLAALASDPSNTELRYRHFSVLQSRSRRLPLLTAVNIDGQRLRRLPRRGRWRLDSRLSGDHQIGNEIYRRNPLDRGHMVRRLDPCWVGENEPIDFAYQAQADTFHYTNAAPQHEDLNQKDWVGLEDYILDASEEFGFKVSVFTGPVFRSDDRMLKRQPGAEDTPIPREFWKVAVMRRVEDGALSATGYVLSHGRMIRDLTEASFTFGAYKTYQTPLRLIEQETGLNFGPLKDADPLETEALQEASFNQVAAPIRGSADIRFWAAAEKPGSRAGAVDPALLAERASRLRDELSQATDDDVESVVAMMMDVVERAEPEKVLAFPPAINAIGDFLDTLAGPRRNALLLTTCDRLLASGYTDPIVAASAAQALVDIRDTSAGGPVAALALLDKFAPMDGPASPNMAAALSMRGRAHKDLFAAALDRGARKQAEASVHAAIESYRAGLEMAQSFEEDGRAWLWRQPQTNIVTLGSILLGEGLTPPPPFRSPVSRDGFRVWINDLAADLRDRLTKKLGLDPQSWDYAALAEVEMAVGDRAAARQALENYLKSIGKEMGRG